MSANPKTKSNNSLLAGKNIVFGVTGCIAAYKAVDAVSRLKKLGADVFVIMTKNAAAFVSPLTFEIMSQNAVVTDTFERPRTYEVEHISLAKKADLFIIAPATANIIAKMAHGIADDMLSTTLLATKSPVLIAPAMNSGMWTAQATSENIKLLKERGISIVGPGTGFLAEGTYDIGRMSEPTEIVDAAISMLVAHQDLSGLRILITAGPTRERLDPVRYMTNDSSGKMGYALAASALHRGAEVTLVSGPVNLKPPENAKMIPIETTMQLYDTLTSLSPDFDIIFQAAAPADYRFSVTHKSKMKKSEEETELLLSLTMNPDIAEAIGKKKKPNQVFVAFAAETENLIENAKKKIEKKNADLIVANDVTKPGAGFNSDTNIITLLTLDSISELPQKSKELLSDDILNASLTIYNSKVQAITK